MSIIISNAFKVIEGRPVTSSRSVAEYFSKSIATQSAQLTPSLPKSLSF